MRARAEPGSTTLTLDRSTNRDRRRAMVAARSPASRAPTGAWSPVPAPQDEVGQHPALRREVARALHHARPQHAHVARELRVQERDRVRSLEPEAPERGERGDARRGVGRQGVVCGVMRAEGRAVGRGVFAC
jgi:hypothetical protein